MGISVWQLLIILAIVLLLFGAKRLRNIGGDLGAAVRGFKQSIKEEGDGQVEKPEDVGGEHAIVGDNSVDKADKEKA